MPNRFSQLEVDRQQLPPAVRLPINPNTRPVPARELAADDGAARSNEEYLFDYSPSEMARHRGIGGTMFLADLDERDEMHVATMLPPD